MKKLMLMAAAAAVGLVSCGGQDTTTPVTGISGKVVMGALDEATYSFKTTPWTGGAGTLTLVDTDDNELGHTTMAADGSFNLGSIATPAASALHGIDMGFWEGENCNSQPNISDTAAKIASAAAIITTTTGSMSAMPKTIIFNEKELTQNVTVWMPIYADRKVSVKGTVNCTYDGQETTSTSNLVLAQGWNSVKFNIITKGNQNNNASTSSLAIENASLPSEWVASDSTSFFPF